MYQSILSKHYRGHNFKPLVSIELDTFSYNYIKEDIKSKIDVKGIVEYASLQHRLKISIIIYFIVRH